MFDRLIAAACRLRLIRRRDGNVSMLFGLCAIVVLCCAGLAVDATRAYTVKVNLGNALDAAVLAVGSTTATGSTTVAALNTRLQNYFNANYPANGLASKVNVTSDLKATNQAVINVYASATVNTTFMSLLGFHSLLVTATSQITKGTNALELALVLDNTGSMMCGDGEMNNCSQGVPPTHMDTLRADAQQIIDTLFTASSDTSKLKIAIVPYVTAVNIGPAMGSDLGLYVPTRSSGTCVNGQGRRVNCNDKNGNPAYLSYNNQVISDANGNNITYDSTQNQHSTEWLGCVVETTANNQDTTEPSGGWTGPWTAYWWTNNSGNRWGSGKNPPANYKETDNGDYNTAVNQSYGPNLACPKPMMRLTNDQASLDNVASTMAARANGGTMINVGMIWGWRALSPNPPFSDGQPYGTPNLVKAVVLETDGDNDVGDYPDYTGYGYIQDGLLGVTTASAALTNLQNRLTTICDNMKAAGIIIYTIGLGDGQNNQQLKDCAGPYPGEFYPAPTAADLTNDFQQIAVSLNQLRLTK